MQEGEVVTGLKDESVTLSCSDGNILVKLASYAEFNDNPGTKCWFNVTMELIRSCQDKKTCSFPVNNAASASAVFGVDPCPGVDMQLKVEYVCS